MLLLFISNIKFFVLRNAKRYKQSDFMPLTNLITKDAYIVYFHNKPVRIRLSEESAYQFITEQTQNPNANEWSIYRTKIDLPSQSQAVSGALNVTIPRHVLE